MKLKLHLFATLLLVAGCDGGLPLNGGHVAIENYGDERREVFLSELGQRNIAFSTFEYEGKEFVQYKSELESTVNDIRAEIDGYAPSGYEGYCPSDPSMLRQLLSEHEIDFVERTVFETNSHCIYWSRAFDNKVRSVDGTYAAILAAESSRQ